jgi:hypothetical protein
MPDASPMTTRPGTRRQPEEDGCTSISSSPIAAPNRPMASCREPPTVAGRRRASKAETALVPEKPSNRTAACKELMSRLAMKKVHANDIRPMTPAPLPNAAVVAAPNPCCRNSRRSSIGCVRPSSVTTKTTNRATASTPQDTTSGLRPARPSVSAVESNTKAAVNDSAPGTSTRRWVSARDSATRAWAVAASATTARASSR